MAKSAKVLRVFKKKGNKPIKFENINLQILRCIKYSQRCIDKGKRPNKGPYTMTKNFSTEKLKIWHELELLFYSDPYHFRNKAKVVKFAHDDVRSANKRFISEFYLDEKLQRYYELSIELWFYDASPTFLCKVFEILCCDSHKHSNECESKWKEFKDYLKGDVSKTYKNEETGDIFENNQGEKESAFDHNSLEATDSIPFETYGNSNTETVKHNYFDDEYELNDFHRI